MEQKALPSELLFGIHKFLTENDLKKTAKALRKEVSLDTTQDNDVNLLEIYRKFLKRKRKSLNYLEMEPSSKHVKLMPEEVLEIPGSIQASALETDIVEIDENAQRDDNLNKEQKKKQKKKSKTKNTTDGLNTDNSTVFANANSHTGFRRVNTDISKVNPMLRDNSFAKKVQMGGSDKSWGKRACDDFRNTSGKTFRHAKTKKKRGSYKGGSIGTEVCSFKFEGSDTSD